MLDKGAQEVFTEIYEKRLWGDLETVSGAGSTPSYTEELRVQLPMILNSLDGVNTLFDAPCGDWAWMKLIRKDIRAMYIGADVVKDLVNKNTMEYSDSRTRFLHLDLIEDDWPMADVVLNRDCLFHIPYKQTKNILKNYIKSKAKYLITTTHGKTIKNTDVIMGGFKMINLLDKPYNFGMPFVWIKDYREPWPERYLGVWRRDQIISALAAGGLDSR